MSHTLTADRIVAAVAALVALAGVVLGALAVARRTGRLGRLGPPAPMLALVAGIAGAVVGALVLATADGGPGTGNGVVGLVAAVLGGVARARGRRFT